MSDSGLSEENIKELERHVRETLALQEVQNLEKKAKRRRVLTPEEINELQELEVESREILQRYHSGMREMQVRLEILNEELKLTRHRNPIHHIESRLKTSASIFEKLRRYGKEATLADMEEYIMDIAGLRVIVSYVKDAYALLNRLQAQDDLTIVTVKDYIANPKPNGYRSLHLIVKIPVYFLDEKRDIPVEIQIRSIAMDFWASLEHDLKYKAVRDVDGIDFASELKACSRVIESVESRMQVMADALDISQAHKAELEAGKSER